MEQTKINIWEHTRTPLTTPSERFDALLSSDLNERVWDNPAQFGVLDYESYKLKRPLGQSEYNLNWPKTTAHLINCLFACNINKGLVTSAIFFEQARSKSTTFEALSMYHALSERLGYAPTLQDAKTFLKDFNAHAHQSIVRHYDEKKNTTVPLIINTANAFIREILQGLKIFDRSVPAQAQYFEWVLEGFNQRVNMQNDVTRSRFGESTKYSIYNYASSDVQESLGCVLAYCLPDMPAKPLLDFLVQHHDYAGLGYLVAQGRLPLSQFMVIASEHQKTETPKRDVGRHNDMSDVYKERAEIKNILYHLWKKLPASEVEQEIKLFKTNGNIDFYVDLEDTVAKKEDSEPGMKDWWRWQQQLCTLTLIDPTNPSPRVQEHLDILQGRIDDITSGNERGEYFAFTIPDYKTPEEKEKYFTKFNTFAKSHPTLATAAWFITLKGVYHHQSPVTSWERLDPSQLEWVQYADTSKFMNAKMLETGYGSDSERLLFAALALPTMSKKDQLAIAPLVCFKCGFNSVQGLSPQTIRKIWKEQDPVKFKPSIPQSYRGDAYLLYALTRQNPDNLINMLNQMEVRNDYEVYSHVVKQWLSDIWKIETPNSTADQAIDSMAFLG